jgi:Protein of unknown function (DUF4087)
MYKKIALALGLFLVSSSAALAAETRCGWLDNPTPANWYLTDKDGPWAIGSQGGFQARGIENIPDLGEREYVKTNGNYGYACACMDVVTDRNKNRFVSIRNSTIATTPMLKRSGYSCEKVNSTIPKQNAI